MTHVTGEKKMTLSKGQTHLLNGFFGDEKMLFQAPFVSNTDYNNLCDEVEEWEAEAANQNLVGTNDDNTTFNFGVVGFPKPPKRS